ncbi:MAG: ribosome recycling factor [Acidimicrobiia bacterium]|nr:ribosome recycling factor [Acidimicrobiia bacterium]
MITDILNDARQKMNQASEHARGEFSTVRTGRANPQILNRVTVEYYGTPTPLQQLATIAVPEPRLMVVQPYDQSSLGEIEKAIGSADLGLNPSNDGSVIRIAFPPLSEERRADLVKVVRNMAEDARVAVRNIRRTAKHDIEAMEGEVSNDDIRRGETDLQELTDSAIAEVDELLAQKESELKEV